MNKIDKCKQKIEKRDEDLAEYSKKKGETLFGAITYRLFKTAKKQEVIITAQYDYNEYDKLELVYDPVRIMSYDTFLELNMDR